MNRARLSLQSDRMGGLVWTTQVAVVTSILLLLLLLLFGFLPGVTGAHEGEAAIELVSLEAGSDPLVLGMSVNVTFAADGHGVSDATVTVTGDSDTGAGLTPVTLAPAGGGLFNAEVAVPEAGTWNLKVTCVTPSGQLDLDPVVVDGADTTVPEPQTDDSVVGVNAGSNGTEAEGEGTVSVPSSIPVEEESDPDSSTSSPWLIALGVVLVVAVVSAVLLTKRSSAAGTGGSDSHSGDSGRASGDSDSVDSPRA